MTFYTVTFCATDQEVGSNPFWHTCLLLSRFDETSKKLEVVEKWGFGGTPASNSAFIRQLKVNLGLDTDFYGNHGVMYEEETRHFEQGKGLHGVSFELSEEDFLRLQQKCHRVADQQAAAIDEAVHGLQLKPSSSTKIRNYPYEHESYRIYQHELQLAAEQNRLPRLHEFSLCIWSEARTCKVHILSLLEGILTPQQIERIAGWHVAVPRLSGTLENIYLHSSGPLSQHKRRSGDVAHYRQGKDVKLYWTLPPQEIETLSDATKNLINIDIEHRQEVKLIIRKLQGLEWFFRDLKLDEKQGLLRDRLVNQIIKLYEAFATIEPKKSQVARNDWSSFWRWLASEPRDVDEKILYDKIDDANALLNNLYMAIMGPWELEVDEVLGSEDPDLETLAAYLPQAQQKKICELIGKNYVDPTEDNELATADIEEVSLESDEVLEEKIAPGMTR